MTKDLSDSLMLRLSEFIVDKTALYFPKERWDDLKRKINSAAKEFDFTNDQEFINWLISTPLSMNQLEILASNLTINETFFWREPKVFEALEEKIFYELIRSRTNGEKRLRIWSAGCSTGEEPYSIAIALKRILPDIEDWNITILATDINPRILRKANEGVYGKWSFRNVPDWLQARYFTPQSDGKYAIVPEIKKMVRFAYLNLAEDVYPSPLNNTNAMDIIFCRNVLMYFEKGRAALIIQNLHRSLIEKGYFFVSSSELSHELFPQFQSVNLSGAIAYKKDGKPSHEAVIYHIAKPVYKTPPELPFDYKKDIEDTEEEHFVIPPQKVLKNVNEIDEKESLNENLYAEALKLFTLGNYSETIQKIENDNTPQAFELCIRSLANLGKLTEAFELCEKAVARNKLDPRLYYLCAMILQEKNKISEAISFLNTALYLESNFSLAYYTKGNLLIRNGNKQQADKCFENVIAILNKSRDVDILPDFDGLTVGRVKEIINATLQIGTSV